MKNSNDNDLTQRLERILRYYNLCPQDKQKFNLIKHANIISLAYTNDGGFDNYSGKYHSEERPITYKLRLYYVHPSTHKVQLMVMLPYKNNKTIESYYDSQSSLNLLNSKTTSNESINSSQ